METKRCQHCSKILKGKSNKFCNRKCQTKATKKKAYLKKINGKGGIAKFIIWSDFYMIPYLPLGYTLYSLIITLSLVSVGFNFFFNFMGKLGFNILGLKSSIYIVLIIFVCLVAIKYIILFTAEKNKQIEFNKKMCNILNHKINSYVILAFFITILLVVVGSKIIETEYGNKFPKTLELYLSEKKEVIEETISGIEGPICKSLEPKKRDFVENDVLQCRMKIQYNNGSSAFPSLVQVFKSKLGEPEEEIFHMPLVYQDRGKDIVFNIKLGESGFNIYRTEFYFKEDNPNKNDNLWFYTLLKENVLSRDLLDYKDKERITIISSVFFIALFSIFAAVKNFRDLVEGGKKNG